MKKQSIPYIFVAIVIIIALVVIVLGNYIDKHTPSKKMVSKSELMEMYGLNHNGAIDSDKQAAIILSNHLIENQAMIEDGVVYLEYHFVKDILNDKFYWDNNENLLLYTLPKDIVKVNVGSNTYEVTKTQNQVDYQIVKTNGTDVYIAMEFVKLYTDMEGDYYENPSRVVINNTWNTEVDIATANNSVKLRKSPKIKADILHSIKDKTEVTITETKGKWSYVYTKDGHFGYIQNSDLKNQTKKTLTSDFVYPDYTSNQMTGKVNLSWQVVTNQAANNQLVGLVTNANGLNVVAPQWYRLSDDEGNMTSFADANYVAVAHRMGLKVWAVVDDQSEKSNNANVFPYTSKREKLVNQLVADAIQYNIDGIIDGQSVIDWNLENCVNLESRSFSDIDCIALLQSWIGYHAHYLVFAQGCRWNGASGYTIVPRILDTLHRPYDATFHYKNHIEGRALICMESSHDVPTGSTTVIVGLTDKEFEKFEDAEFSEVEAFAEQFIE